MATDKPVLVSGIKPTGDLHIGNYFGAMRQQVALAKEGKYTPYIFVADYHALNSVQDAKEMRERTKELVMGYLAAGLDPDEVVLFKQSDVPAHTELAWIFDTITDIPYLARAHAFKAAVDKLNDARPAQRALSSKLEQLTDVGVGVFNYPMLMAADILLYDAKVVPVGQDQKQHIEYARDTAEKFNRTFKENIFTLPEAHILPEVAVVPGTDGQKMSKSYKNVIPLFASRDELSKAVMGIVTDSSGKRPENVYAIHKLVKDEKELESLYKEKHGSYKELKEALVEDLDKYFAEMRSNYEELRQNPDVVEEVLARGKEAARAVSEKKMEAVRRAIGVAG